MPRFVSFDVESHRIKPGMVCPRLVCLSWAENGYVDLLDRSGGVAWLREQLEGDAYLVGHNIPYDLSVVAAEDPEWFVPRIFAAYEAGRIRDTIIRQNLIDIAKGEHKMRASGKTAYGLDVLVKLHLGIDLPKTGDTPADPGYWRLRYGSLDGVPLSQWPAPARQYAEDDARWTSRLWARMFEDEAFDIPNEIEQNQAAWALRLASIWGIRTNTNAVAQYRVELEHEITTATAALKKLGFVRQEGTRDMEAIRAAVTTACTKQERPVKKTGKGAVATSKALLKEMGDPDLKVLADSAETRTNFTRYLPMLELGTAHPMTPGWVTCVETGRVACREPNIMNPPRKGKVRECIVPRPGFLLAACDYDTAELRSWAQVCIDLVGYSATADAIRDGHDLHIKMSASILNIPFAEAQSRYDAGDTMLDTVRQLSKIPDFGLPGGMGTKRLLEALLSDKKLVAELTKVGIKVDFDFAGRLREAWRNAFPESIKYFEHITSLVGDSDAATITQVRSGRIRGQVGYSDGCNGFFQGLTADGAKAALWAVSKECYTMRGSPLYGSRVVIFLHDELILEVPVARASIAAKRMQEVMCAEMQRWLPDVPVTATAVLMRRWTKGTKPVHDKAGNLVPSRPEKRDDKTVWVADV